MQINDLLYDCYTKFINNFRYCFCIKTFGGVRKMMQKWLSILFVLVLVALPLAAAVEFNETISPEDKAKFDQMLSPVMKIYNFVKYAATAIAVVILLFAGISFMMNGGDPKKRDDSKHMVTYTVIGLVVIWIAPLIVNFITA
jgi:type IV secretory pathway VirB2 component (pilin)